MTAITATKNVKDSSDEKFETWIADFEAGSETLSKTGLGRICIGFKTNFERSLRVGDRMGGHFVTGHVDGQGKVIQRRDDGEWTEMVFAVNGTLASQIVPKGSITIDGVSLTVVDADDHQFSVALIPHTLENTTLKTLQIGDEVNLETDILAKYVQKNRE